MGMLYSSRRALLDSRAAFPWWDPNGGGLCVWSAYQPIGAASFAASLVDLSENGNPAGDPGGAATPVWDAVNGWRPDGIQTYLTTTFNPQTDQSQSMLVQFTNAAVSNGRIAGAQAAANRRFTLTPNSAAGGNTYENGGLINGAAGAFPAGNIGVAGNQGYRNGVADGAPIGAWGAAIPDTVYIGAWGAPAGFFKDVDIQALAIYDCVLTAPQMLAIATAMAAL